MADQAVKHFANDAKWSTYWTNISDTLSEAQKSKNLLKYKIKYFKNNINAELPDDYKPWTCPYELVTVEAKTKHTATVIFLHGLGDSGDGWSDTFAMIQNQLSPRFDHVKFICPSATAQSVTLNMGYVMPAWYDIKGLSENAEEDEEGIQKTAQQIVQLIEQEMKQTGIASNKIILGGFSQGGSIALYAGLTMSKPLGGILGMSTYACLRKYIAQHIQDSNVKTPLLMCHGNIDPVVKFAFGQVSFYAIQQMRDAKVGQGNHSSEFKTYPTLQHSSSPQELRDVAQWLEKLV